MQSSIFWLSFCFVQTIPDCIPYPLLQFHHSHRCQDIIPNAKLSNTTIPSVTVKLARANLPADAGNFTCGSQVKRPPTQFTCVTCSLPLKTGKFAHVYAASTSSRIHANCLQPHVILPEYNRYFTFNFTCGFHANLPATSMQNCLLLQAKIHAICRQKH